MTSLLTKRWLHTIILLSFLGLALTARLSDATWLKAFSFPAFDTYNKISPREPTDKVVIVDIDEVSLSDRHLGQWPWPRTVTASLVDNLTALGAKAIIFDMVFSEKDRTSPSSVLRQIGETDLSPEAVASLKSLPENDDVLAESFRASKKVVTGFVMADSSFDEGNVPREARGIQFGKGTDELKKRMRRIDGIITTLPLLEDAATGNGFFGATPEYDGLIRSVSLLQRVKDGGEDRDTFYALLALEGIRVAETDNRSLRVVSVKGKSDSKYAFLSSDEKYGFLWDYEVLVDKKFTIPLDDDARFYLHYAPARPQSYIPAWTVINNTVDPSKIKDKIVLVGTSAIGLKDIRSTPLDLYIPGVEVHLNVIEQILQGRYLSRPYSIIAVETCFILAVGIFIVLLAPFINAIFLFIFTLLSIGGITGFSYWMYLNTGLLLDPVFPSIVNFLLFVAAVMLTYIRTESERRAVRQAFGLYISPDYMKELADNPDQLRLGGELRDITVMFTDIRGFTSISEQLKPDELIHLMNDFLTPMSDLVMSNRGTIDKYMGDAMMAFWNAPLKDAEHQRNACLAALSMNEALKPINERIVAEAAAKGTAPLILKAGIGVNSGPGAVGNMGSKQRFAYSVMGDTVNLASRLEGQTKGYGVDILIGETTADAVRDFALLELDLIRVKGKQVPVRVFTLLGTDEESKKPEFHLLQLAHKKMLNLYREREFKAAADSLQDCLAHAPLAIHGYYEMMRERIAEMQKTPPDESWDGVFVAQSK